MAKGKPRSTKSRKTMGVAVTFRKGPTYERIEQIKTGDRVFIDPSKAGATIFHRLELTPAEVERSPITVCRLELQNGMVFVQGRRVAGVFPGDLRKAIVV